MTFLEMYQELKAVFVETALEEKNPEHNQTRQIRDCFYLKGEKMKNYFIRKENKLRGIEDSRKQGWKGKKGRKKVRMHGWKNGKKGNEKRKEGRKKSKEVNMIISFFPPYLSQLLVMNL